MTSSLNWQNDPLLLDPKPVPKTKWVTANDLLEQGKGETIIKKDYTLLNLYGLLVRKSDFVRTTTRDRIIARFPFLVVTPEQKEWIRTYDLLLSQAARDYFYRSINQSILSWRKRVNNYLKRGILPYPIYRLGRSLETKEPPPRIGRNDNVPFSSARGEKFHMPTQITNEIAYIAGVINGDGNLRRYILSIVDFSIKHIEKLQNQFEALFGQEGRIQWQTENCPELIITNKWVIRFFSFLTGQPIDQKKYAALQEPLLFKKEPFRTYYWAGVFDADGSYANNNISFSSASKNYAKEFQQFLETKGIQSKFKIQSKRVHRVNIQRGFHTKFKRYFKSFHPDKRIEFQNLHGKRSIYAKQFVGFNKRMMVNGYFNFRLLKGLRVCGLTDFLTEVRRGRMKKEFARSLGIAQSSYREMEAGQYGITLSLLEKILALKGQILMPFLAGYDKPLRYRMRSSKKVKLFYTPCDLLSRIASQLTFFDNLIRLPTTSNVRNDVQKHFDTTVEDNTITTKVILDYFKAFCLFSKK
jgi:hypothetical protein